MKTDIELRSLLKKAIKEAGGLRKWATNKEISPSAVSVAMREKTKPFSPRIAKILGYKKVRGWVLDKKKNG